MNIITSSTPAAFVRRKSNVPLITTLSNHFVNSAPAKEAELSN